MKNKQQSHQLNDFKTKALATFTVFARNETILGLPTKVFLIGITVSLSTILLIYWLAGVAFGLAYFYGMYKIHQQDPKAFDVWIIATRRFFTNKFNRWEAGKCQSTRLIIFKKGD